LPTFTALHNSPAASASLGAKALSNAKLQLFDPAALQCDRSFDAWTQVRLETPPSLSGHVPRVRSRGFQAEGLHARRVSRDSRRQAATPSAVGLGGLRGEAPRAAYMYPSTVD
jgi:hypothetical protein